VRHLDGSDPRWVNFSFYLKVLVMRPIEAHL
jgi:hypothetical protein